MAAELVVSNAIHWQKPHFFFLSRPGCKPGLWKVDHWSTQGKESINAFGSIVRGTLEDPNFQREMVSASRAVATLQARKPSDTLRANRTEPLN